MLGILKPKHHLDHAHRMLTYSLDGDMADTYFALKALLAAYAGVDRFRENHRRISQRKASRKCVSCNRNFSFDDTSNHCRKHWTKCPICAWTTE